MPITAVTLQYQTFHFNMNGLDASIRIRMACGVERHTPEAHKIYIFPPKNGRGEIRNYVAKISKHSLFDIFLPQST